MINRIDSNDNNSSDDDDKRNSNNNDNDVYRMAVTRNVIQFC